MNQTDKMISAIRQDIELPAVVTHKTQEAFRQILAESRKETEPMVKTVQGSAGFPADYMPYNTEKKHRKMKMDRRSDSSRKSRRRSGLPLWAKVTAAASAVLLLSFGFCVTNPVLAAKIPVIGRLFSLLQEASDYPGDYSDYVQPLEETAPAQSSSASDEAASSSWSRTADGVTVTLSEVYCNQEALSISVMVEGPEPFRDLLEENMDGSRYLSLEACSLFSFQPEPYVGSNQLEGTFLDDKTFIGIWRIELREVLMDQSRIQELVRQAEAEGREFPITQEVLEQYADWIDLPGQFTLHIDLEKIVGNLAEPARLDYGMSTEELEALSDEEFRELYQRLSAQAGLDQYPNASQHYWFEGPWSFDVTVTVNASDILEIPVHEQNADGIGLDSLLLTPFELRVNAIMQGGDYIPVVLDAQGKWMDPGTGDVSILPVAGHDVSQVTVCLCDFELWYSTLKVHRDQPSLQEVLEENAVWYRTVVIPQQ